jgi:hypothetical protein
VEDHQLVVGVKVGLSRRGHSTTHHRAVGACGRSFGGGCKSATNACAGSSPAEGQLVACNGISHADPAQQ